MVMSIDSTNNVNNSVNATALAAKECIQHNWNNHQVKVISSGVSTLALAGGIIAASLLGGPVGLIIGLAAATLLALGAFVVSILAQPKNVKPLELPTEKSVEITETPLVVAEQVVTAEAEAVQQAVAVEKQSETAQVETKEEEKQTETAPVQAETTVESETTVEKETPKASRLATAASFVKAHKLAFGLGAAALATAGAGLYYYGAFSAVAAAAAPTCANAAKASVFTNTCSAASAPMAAQAAQTIPGTCSAASTLSTASLAASKLAKAAAGTASKTICYSGRIDGVPTLACSK